MECSLLALIACFSWSNLYVDGGISYQDSSIPYFYWKDVSPPPREDVEEQVFISALGHHSQNPYGLLAIGYQLDFQAVTMSLEVSHASSVATNTDRGVNAISLRAKWFPFR